MAARYSLVSGVEAVDVTDFLLLILVTNVWFVSFKDWKCWSKTPCGSAFGGMNLRKSFYETSSQKVTNGSFKDT